MQVLRTMGIALSVSALFIWFTGCSSDDSASGVTATVKVASMATHPASRTLSKKSVPHIAGQRVAVDAAKLVPSTTAYSFAVVDGVKYHLTKLRAERAGSDDAVDVAISGDLNFTDSSTQTVALNQSVSWPTGSFRGISVHMDNAWSVKGYCRTQYDPTHPTTSGFLVYSRAGGNGVVDCGSVSADCTVLPSDYDFHAYTFLSTYSGYVNTNDYQQETHSNFTVNAGDAPTVSLLYDGSYGVTCWDGRGSWSDPDAIGGMKGVSPVTTFYPALTPAFGTFYLPVFGYVSTNANEAAPSARTFITSTVGNSDLDTTGVSFNFADKPVVTLVYKADGSIYAGSTRNFQGNGASAPFDLDLEGFTANGSGYDFYSSGWYYTGTGSPTFVRNRKFTAFTPNPTVGTVFQSDAADGADCGQTMIDFQNNNPSRACHGSTQSLWWREVTR